MKLVVSYVVVYTSMIILWQIFKVIYRLYYTRELSKLNLNSVDWGETLTALAYFIPTIIVGISYLRSL